MAACCHGSLLHACRVAYVDLIEGIRIQPGGGGLQAVRAAPDQPQLRARCPVVLRQGGTETGTGPGDEYP